MELSQLRYFINVARKQHVTHAAEELHVAQSAVSRQIHMLEEELNLALFIQKGRNLQLTPVGHLFQNKIEAILSDLDRAVQEAHEFIDPEKGEIRIGFPHSLGVNLLPTVVACFRKEHPNVKFRLKQGTFQSLIRDIIEGEIDLAFISPFPESHEFVAGEVLLTEELFAILPANHPLSHKHSIHLEQLKDEPFVMFSKEYSLRAIVMNACMGAGFVPLLGFEGAETDTIRGLVAAGLGVSLLPDMATAETGPLQVAKVRLKKPTTRTIGLIWRKNERLPLVANAFQQFLVHYFRN